MLSEIDIQLFPTRCEVIQIGSSQRFVFPIMKNGSSSFYMPVQLGLPNDFKIFDIALLDSDQIQQPFITFLRDPKERFISGVNTYLQHLIRDNGNLDPNTIIWFVDNYLFLNRHYCPQFFWLLNLAMIIGPDVKFELNSMSDIARHTSYRANADVVPPSREFLDRIEKFNWEKLELYFYLDKVIMELIGQTVTFRQILSKVKQNDVLDTNILKPTLQISTLLNALP
jgi:hypothetical protein